MVSGYVVIVALTVKRVLGISRSWGGLGRLGTCPGGWLMGLFVPKAMYLSPYYGQLSTFRDAWSVGRAKTQRGTGAWRAAPNDETGLCIIRPVAGRGTP